MADLDLDTLYSRCPACGLVAPPGSSLEVPLTTDGGTDWSRGIRLTCHMCGHVHTIFERDLVDRDAVHDCPRCHTPTPVPASAAEVTCRSCHLYAPGPGRTDHTAAVQRQHHRQMRDAYLRVRRAAGYADDEPLT